MGKGSGKGSTVGKLSSSKGPQCSEMNARVQGCVKSIEEQHRKQVELMFRDRNLVLSRVNKSQSLVYRTMLRVHKEKKIRERELYRRHVEASTTVGSEPKHARASAVTSSCYDSGSSAYSEDDDSSEDVESTEVTSGYTHHLPQLNRQVTKTEIDTKWNKPQPKLRSLTLPEIPETYGLCGKPPTDEETDATTNSKDPNTHGENDRSSATWPGPWPTDTDRSNLSPNSKHHRVRVENPPSLQQPSLGCRRLSYLEMARMKTSDLQMMRKEQLDKEPVVDYVTNDDGNIVPRDDKKDYQRQRFPMPSLRQQHQQQKLLQTELSAAAQHKEKADRFFERLEIENAETAAAARQRRHLAKMAAIKAGRSSEASEKSGITLADLVAVFQQSEKLADGVDPNSLEAVKICKYVRKCQPLMMTKEERRNAKVNKLSSWHYAREKTQVSSKYHAR